jgi:hypothetical protein
MWGLSLRLGFRALVTLCCGRLRRSILGDSGCISDVSLSLLVRGLVCLIWLLEILNIGHYVWMTKFLYRGVWKRNIRIPLTSYTTYVSSCGDL